MGKSKKRVPDSPIGPDKSPAVQDLIAAMIEEISNPWDVLELFYMTRDMELMNVYRDVASLERKERVMIGHLVHSIARPLPDRVDHKTEVKTVSDVSSLVGRHKARLANPRFAKAAMLERMQNW
jgi:hypothetical protein